jgi:hypothetical protein
MSTVTMQELELETAELLPARETLGCHRSNPCCGGSSVTQVGLVNINNSFNNNTVLIDL